MGDNTYGPNLVRTELADGREASTCNDAHYPARDGTGQLLRKRRNLFRLPKIAPTPSQSQAGTGARPEAGAEILQPLLSLALELLTGALGTQT